MSHLHVVVHGRVQGVGFRWFVRESARSLGLAGWVRNHADGSVEVVAEGDGTAIVAFREALAQGPPGAAVSRVDDAAPSSAPVDRPFTILR